MFNDHMFNGNFLKACLAAVFALALTACSSSSDSVTMTPDPDPTPTATAYETAKAAIAAAETAEAVDAALAAAEAAGGISAAQLRSLEMAVDDRKMELAAAVAKERRDMLVAAAACEAATAECVAAHDALIAALQADVDRLADDDDATNAQQAAAQDALEDAQTARAMVQMDLDELDRTTTAGREVGEAIDAANGLEDDRSADAIAAAKVAIEEAEMAVGESDAYDERIAMAKTAVARAEELNAIDDAIDAAEMAADGLATDSSVAAVAAAQKLIDDAQALIGGNEHLTDEEEAADNGYLAGLQRTVTVAKNQNDAAAEAKRLADEKAAADKDKADAAAMAATAAKLYAGISAQMGAGDGTTFAATDRDAFYNTAATAILVSIGDGTNVHSAVSATLSEDKKTTVAKNHGWTGKRYADPAGGDSYEAVVYSNVEAPKMGKKFGGAAADDEFEYALTDGALPSSSFEAKNVAFTGVTRTAGTETFKLPDPNPSGADIILVPGTYHGVSGTYNCTPAVAADGCSAAVAEEGFTVSADDTWTFTPGNANARVRDAADTDYASYGWWLKKTANDQTYTASAFVDEKGTVNAASGLNDLNGKATYRGGAAGKYALASSTGGTNDAGHFTARATLEANFTTNTAETAITGTLDMFIGADGQSRDWSVKLNGSQIGDTGEIGNASASTDVDTVWTIGETAAAKSGNWTGTLRNNGDDLVPQVATGTFYTEYGTAGKMVGAFGANKQ